MNLLRNKCSKALIAFFVEQKLARLCVLIIINIILVVSSLFAQDNTFNGNGGDPTNFIDPDNWSLNHVPAGSEKAVIPVGYYVLLEDDLNEPDLTIENYGEFEMDDDLTIGIMKCTGSSSETVISNNRQLTVNIYFQLNSGGTVEINGSLICNYVLTITNSSTSYMNIGNSGTLSFTDNIFATKLILHNVELVNNGEIIGGNQGAYNFMLLDYGSTFVNNGSLLKTGLGHSGIDASGATITNNGVMQFEMSHNVSTNYPILDLHLGTFTNNGSITITEDTSMGIDDFYGGIQLSGGGDFFNNGDLEIYSGDDYGIQIVGDFINNGSVTIYDITGNAIEGLNGLSGEYLCESESFIDGSIEYLDMSWDGGELYPGTSPGKITHYGNLNLDGSIVKFEIAGAGQQGVSYDQIEVIDGNLALGVSGAEVNLINGFEPEAGDMFLMMKTTSGGIPNGEEFSSLSLPSLGADLEWNVFYTNTKFILTVSSTILPLDLLSFDVTNNSGEHILEWSTVFELNTSHFDIEFSTDGKNWNMVGKTESVGNSNDLEKYSYRYIPEPVVEEFYYRLKMVDLDGLYEYSNIVNVDVRNKTSQLGVYPNPVFDNIHIVSPEDCYLIDANNKLLGFYRAGEHDVNIGDLEPGIYFLKSSDSVQKLIKL